MFHKVEWLQIHGDILEIEHSICVHMLLNITIGSIASIQVMCQHLALEVLRSKIQVQKLYLFPHLFCCCHSYLCSLSMEWQTEQKLLWDWCWAGVKPATFIRRINKRGAQKHRNTKNNMLHTFSYVTHSVVSSMGDALIHSV